MYVPITETLLREADEFQLRSACPHCFFFLADRCVHEWPNADQRRWPMDAALADGAKPAHVALCKEFELA